jgi:hypothetical protein
VKRRVIEMVECGVARSLPRMSTENPRFVCKLVADGGVQDESWIKDRIKQLGPGGRPATVSCWNERSVEVSESQRGEIEVDRGNEKVVR